MAFEDLFQTASEQLDTPSDSAAGLPSYLHAANNHQLAGSGFSLMEPSSYKDAILDTGKFAVSAVVRGISSVYNIVPSMANWAGADIEEADTYNWISKVDSNLATYYAEHEQSVNIVGDIGASFVPGMVGIKALNMGQKALAVMGAGKQGFNLAAHIGLLPTRAAAIGFEEGKKLAATAQSFKYLNANILKGIAMGYEQQVLEQGAFLAAAQVAMHKSPLFDHEDAGDIFWNALGGGVVGGGILGTVAAVQTLGAVRKGVSYTNKLLNPASLSAAAEGSANATDKIIYALHDIHHPPEAPLETNTDILKAFDNKLAKRNDQLWHDVRTNIHSITGDTELGNVITDSLRGLPYDQAVGNIQYLQNIGRLGKEGKATALEKLADKIVKGKVIDDMPNVAINYLKLSGEDVGKVLLERPPIVNLADTLANSAQVEKAVKSYKFEVGDNWSPALAKNHYETEARQIWASNKTLDFDTVIGARDLPLLERAHELGLQQVTLTGGKTIDSSQQLLEYIKQVKGEQAVALRELDMGGKLTTEEIAKRINVKRSYLEGDKNDFRSVDDILAFQSKPKDHWKTPSYAKLAYDVQPMNDLSGHVMDAITHAKANQKELREAADRAFTSAFPEINAKLPAKIGDKAVQETTRYGADGSLISGQNGNYGTIGSIAQQIGSVMNKWKGDLFKRVDDTFSAPAYAVLNDPKAKDDIVKAYNLVLGSPEKYVLSEDGTRLVNAKIAKWEAEGSEGTAPLLLDKNSPTELAIDSEAAQRFLATMISHNDKHLESVNKRLQLQVGTSSQADLRGSLYFAPPDPKNFPHFAFVTDSTITGTGHVRMIHAASSSELEQLIAKVDSGIGLKVVTKAENEAFHKAMQDYQYSLGINENYINAAMTRQGVSAPFFATTDAQKIVEEFLDWRKRIDVSNAREWIKLKYAPEVENLNQLARSHNEVALSVKANTGKYAASEVANPYSNIVKTMLDVSTKDEYPIWTPLNRLAEKSVSALVGRMRESFSTAEAEADVSRVSKMLEDAGIHANFTDAATMVLANHRAPKPVLEEFIRKANSVLSFMMLRADPLNAINNGLGHTVLYGTETRDLIKNIKAGNVGAAGKLAELANVKIPGKDLGEILSPMKLATNAYSDYAKLLSGNPEMKALEVMFREHGWMPTMLDQEKSIMEAMTLRGMEAPSELAVRSAKILEGAKSLAKPVTSLNQGVEDMNRFVSAHTAKSISDLAIEAGVMTKDEQLAYINTFVNRTQGNYIASQRPMLFSGPVGQAVGLFQTYQFNLMQQLFRYVAEGTGNKSAGYLLGLQGTVYGMNGLPAFNAINQHLVGNASGNVQHKDITSQTYDTVGKEAGDWLLYGMSSNLFLHPDLKVNLYSRGDINPRQVTVIPTTLADVPVVGAVTKFFTSLKATGEKIAAGADVYSTFLQGVEHSGISRPLAGLAQTLEAFGNPKLQAYSTTSKGSIVGSNDLMSLTTFGRMLGGRPLDEAIANDAVYRIQSYASARNHEINTLGEAIKTKVQTGTLDSESLTGFMKEYAERGGKQDQFSRYMSRLMLSSNKATANSIADNLKNPGSQYMQQIMGGYRLQDMVNQ